MTFLGMPHASDTTHLAGKPFPTAARAAVADTQLRRNLGNATATIRAKRARVVGEVPDWESLRAAGAAIKDSVLANLDDLLVQLEEAVTARGGTVDEPTLIRALLEGWIAGAGLDVLEQEPPAPGNPLLTHPGVLWTPHTAGHGVGSLADNRQHSIDEILRVFRGEWPVALVNPEARDRAQARGWPIR